MVYFGSTEDSEFSGVGSSPVVLEIRGFEPLFLTLIKVTLLSDIFLCLWGNACCHDR